MPPVWGLAHDIGVENQRSLHAIMWADREKPQWKKTT